MIIKYPATRSAVIKNLNADKPLIITYVIDGVRRYWWLKQSKSRTFNFDNESQCAQFLKCMTGAIETGNLEVKFPKATWNSTWYYDENGKERATPLEPDYIIAARAAAAAAKTTTTKKTAKR